MTDWRPELPEREVVHDFPEVAFEPAFSRGDIAAAAHPYNLSEDEAERYAAEVREREARRRPPGFGAWLEGPPS